MDILYIHIHHYKNALQNAHAQRAFFWLTLPGKATLFDDSHLFGIYSFISHVGFSTRGVHKETQNKYGHIVSPWEIMMKHDKNDFRDNTFSDKSGCDFKLSPKSTCLTLDGKWIRWLEKRLQEINICYLPLIYKETYKWRTKLLTIRNGHGQSGWSPIGCKGLYFHAMCENGVPASGWCSPIKVLAQIWTS